MKRLFSTLMLSAVVVGAVAQDFKMPAPSPTTTVKQEFSTSFIELIYSRPAMRGRKIFGDLVPYGKVWRTGANAATKISFGEEVSVGGQKVPAGTYSLYTIPGEKEWKIIINKNTGNWGATGFDDKDDIATFTVPTHKISETIQSFSISVNNITLNSCDILLLWENTAVMFQVKADNDKAITEYLDKQLQGDKPPYQQAANYYLETNKNLDQAVAYADKAIEANKDAFYLYWLKARILAKQGKKADAIAAAKMAADKAATTPSAEEYNAYYQGMMKDLK